MAISVLNLRDFWPGWRGMVLVERKVWGLGTTAPNVSMFKNLYFKTNTEVLQPTGFDLDFWVNILFICSLHNHISRFSDYVCRASKHKNWKELEPYKFAVFKNNEETLELLNYFQIFNFNQQKSVRTRCRPEPEAPTPLATPLLLTMIHSICSSNLQPEL